MIIFSLIVMLLLNYFVFAMVMNGVTLGIQRFRVKRGEDDYYNHNMKLSTDFSTANSKNYQFFRKLLQQAKLEFTEEMLNRIEFATEQEHVQQVNECTFAALNSRSESENPPPYNAINEKPPPAYLSIFSDSEQQSAAEFEFEQLPYDFISALMEFHLEKEHEKRFQMRVGWFCLSILLFMYSIVIWCETKAHFILAPLSIFLLISVIMSFLKLNESFNQ